MIGEACERVSYDSVFTALVLSSYAHRQTDRRTDGQTRTDTDRHGQTRTDTDRHRQTQTDTDRHRQTQTDTDRHRQTQTDTDRHRQTQTDTDRHRQTQTDTDRHRQTQTDTDRHRQTQTDTDRHRQTQTDTDRHRQTQTDTDRHRQTQTDTDRHRQTQTDTDRDRQRQTETDRDRRTAQAVAHIPCRATKFKPHSQRRTGSEGDKKVSVWPSCLFVRDTPVVCFPLSRWEKAHHGSSCAPLEVGQGSAHRCFHRGIEYCWWRCSLRRVGQVRSCLCGDRVFVKIVLEMLLEVVPSASQRSRSRSTCVVMCQSFSGFVVVVVVVVDVFCLQLRQQIRGGAGFSRVSLRESYLGVEANLVIPPHTETSTST